MDETFKRRRKEGVISFRLLGIVSCKKCANGWKETLMRKGKKVRLQKSTKGWEVWATA